MPSEAPSVPNKGPPLHLFPTSDLPSRVNTTENGKRRKPPVKLEDCKLVEMTQYTCNIQNKFSKDAAVVCRPFNRLFRQCADGLTVETTDWEWFEKS